MFAKLLKHEWRATKSVIGLLCVIILISGLMIGGVAHYMMKVEQGIANFDRMPAFAEVMCILLVMAAVVAVAVCCAGSVLYVVYHFYKSRFTDEGYLTFTLPVGCHQLLLSNILNSIVSVFFVILACFAAIGIAVALFLVAFPQNLIWADVSQSMEAVMQQLWDSLVKNAGQFVRFGFSIVVGSVSELVVLMLAVTIGSLAAKKHKLLAAAGVYCGTAMVKSLVYSALAVSATTTQDVNRFLTAPGLLGLVIAIGAYFLMYWLISRKLNLT